MNNSEKNRVLIVDDEKSNLEVLFNILNPEYTIFTAKNGAAAIEIANKYLPDIVLLDIIMPDMNGFDVLAALKASGKTKNIPVIFITGLDSVEDEEKGLELEAVDFIHKPFSPKIVKSRVRNQIQIINQIRELVALHKDLEAAVKTAGNTNKTKSAFLAKMSHEIRTSMNAILGISEIQLQNKNLFPDVMKAFSRIYNSGELLLGIINDILDMSKIEAGKLELTQKNYDVARMIYDTVFLNTIKYEAKPVEFIINVNENVPSELFGDEPRIKQILNNLLSNAFKYTDSGEVELSVDEETAPDTTTDTTMLIFRVRDTGQEMTEEQVDKLFDDCSHFNMEANMTTEGIGLGITKNLTDMMNGEILVESKHGSGSLFTVRLPQGKTGAPPLGKEAAEKLKQFRSNYESKTEKTKIVYE
ncbi:MAG: hybrid sensor histidine kinase/response regulator [Treponema sp.]|jgi:K+-sensing histidine kinase KdpD|nr:hybrid sensor histidine kinase/response regulator [Treponema sp.]